MTAIITRRRLLEGSCALLCACRMQVPGDSGKTCAFELSLSFADLALAFLAEPRSDLRQQLVEEPALAIVARHQNMAGRTVTPSYELLDELLMDHEAEDLAAARHSLTSWKESALELASFVELAADYLPEKTPLCGRIYVVIGYEMAAAAPPDILVNAAHPRFRQPQELRYLLVHEAHHLGFLHWRQWPPLESLFEGSLAELLRFATQMEGMAVHASYPPRAAAGALEADGDYAVYVDDELAENTVRAYSELWYECQRRLPVERATEILERMSTGERLWYRFGALVAAEIERGFGRAALTATIRDPAAYWRMAERLMSRAAVRSGY